ncbi:hypothetical protein C8R44DRAFT_751333 [Mycena epipterygia]|nr:hypothetical protein C8R44DRAFT_751333 [Mycena epipterygia]
MLPPAPLVFAGAALSAGPGPLSISTPVYVNLRVATCGDVRLRAATYGPSPSLTYVRLRLATWRRHGPATRQLRQFIAILVLHRFNAYNESKPTREVREKGCIQK